MSVNITFLGGPDTVTGSPYPVSIDHWERGASHALRQDIEHQLKWRALVPEHGSTWPV